MALLDVGEGDGRKRPREGKFKGRWRGAKERRVVVVVIGARVVRARLLPKLGLGLVVVDDGGGASASSSSLVASVVAVVPRVEGVGRVKMFLRSVGMFLAGVRAGAEVVGVAGVIGVERRGLSLKRLAPTPARAAGVVGFSVVLLLACSSYSYSTISYSSSAAGAT